MLKCETFLATFANFGNGLGFELIYNNIYKCQSEINRCYEPKYPMNSKMQSSIFWQNNNFGHYWATTFYIYHLLFQEQARMPNRMSNYSFFPLAFDVSCPPKKTNESKFLFFMWLIFPFHFYYYILQVWGKEVLAIWWNRWGKKGSKAPKFVTIWLLLFSLNHIEELSTRTAFRPCFIHICVLQISYQYRTENRIQM